jgi:uncharacterized protein
MSRRASDSLITMVVSSLTVDPITSIPAVLLREREGSRAVAIPIGLGEATAIAAELGKIELERPMTHHLLSAIMDRAGVRIEGVEIQDTATGRASINLRMPGGEMVAQDARPSDAMALALRTGVPIRVAPRVLTTGRGAAAVRARAKTAPADAIEVAGVGDGPLGDISSGSAPSSGSPEVRGGRNRASELAAMAATPRWRSRSRLH